MGRDATSAGDAAAPPRLHDGAGARSSTSRTRGSCRTRRHAGADRRVVRRARRRRHRAVAWPGALHRREPRRGHRHALDRAAELAGRTRRRGARRRRRRAEHAALPADRRPHAACRCWPGRSRRRRSATCSSRPAPPASSARASRDLRALVARTHDLRAVRRRARLRGSVHEGRADGHVHQRRAVPGHGARRGDAAAAARRGGGLPRGADVLRAADGQHRLPRRGGPAVAVVRRRPSTGTTRSSRRPGRAPGRPGTSTGSSPSAVRRPGAGRGRGADRAAHLRAAASSSSTCSG